jgi:hypothetical protein
MRWPDPPPPIGQSGINIFSRAFNAPRAICSPSFLTIFSPTAHPVGQPL